MKNFSAFIFTLILGLACMVEAAPAPTAQDWLGGSAIDTIAADMPCLVCPTQQDVFTEGVNSQLWASTDNVSHFVILGSTGTACNGQIKVVLSGDDGEVEYCYEWRYDVNGHILINTVNCDDI